MGARDGSPNGLRQRLPGRRWLVPGSGLVYRRPEGRSDRYSEVPPMSADVLAKVTEEEVQRFQEEGAVRLRDVFDPYWVDRVAAGVERNLAEPGPYAKLYTPKGNPGFFFGDYCNWSRFPELREFVLRSPAGAIAGRVMGSRQVRIF